MVEVQLARPHIVLNLADGQSSPDPALYCSTPPYMLLPALTRSSQFPAARNLQQQYVTGAEQLAGDQRGHHCMQTATLTSSVKMW